MTDIVSRLFLKPDFLLIVLLLFPITIAVGITYKHISENYGDIIETSEWKRMVQCIVNALFYIIFLCLFCERTTVGNEKNFWFRAGDNLKVNMFYIVIVAAVGLFLFWVLDFITENRPVNMVKIFLNEMKYFFMRMWNKFRIYIEKNKEKTNELTEKRKKLDNNRIDYKEKHPTERKNIQEVSKKILRYMYEAVGFFSRLIIVMYCMVRIIVLLIESVFLDWDFNNLVPIFGYWELIVVATAVLAFIAYARIIFEICQRPVKYGDKYEDNKELKIAIDKLKTTKSNE